jgi:hypothetical protein
MPDRDKHVPPMRAAEPHEDTVWMTPAEVADRHRKEEATLANERYRGEGLPYLKLPSGRVLYNLDDVLATERAGMRGFSWSRLSDALGQMHGLSDAQREAIVAHLKKFFD